MAQDSKYQWSVADIDNNYSHSTWAWRALGEWHMLFSRRALFTYAFIGIAATAFVLLAASGALGPVLAGVFAAKALVSAAGTVASFMAPIVQYIIANPFGSFMLAGLPLMFVHMLFFSERQNTTLAKSENMLSAYLQHVFWINGIVSTSLLGNEVQDATHDRSFTTFVWRTMQSYGLLRAAVFLATSEVAEASQTRMDRYRPLVNLVVNPLTLPTLLVGALTGAVVGIVSPANLPKGGHDGSDFWCSSDFWRYLVSGGLYGAVSVMVLAPLSGAAQLLDIPINMVTWSLQRVAETILTMIGTSHEDAAQFLTETPQSLSKLGVTDVVGCLTCRPCLETSEAGERVLTGVVNTPT